MTKTMAVPVELLERSLSENPMDAWDARKELRALLDAPESVKPAGCFTPKPGAPMICENCNQAIAYHQLSRCPDNRNVAYSNKSVPLKCTGHASIARWCGGLDCWMRNR